MITGELKSKVDSIWDTMWAEGISNPLTVVEQLTYLLFVKRLDELQTLEEIKGGADREGDRAAGLRARRSAPALVALQGRGAGGDVRDR